MKKKPVFSALVVLIAVCVMFSAWGVSAETAAVLGDIDGSGAVDSNDLTILARFVARIDVPTEAQKTAADVTKNGSVNSDDLTLMARYVAHLITSFETSEKPSFDDPGSFIIVPF